MTAAHSSGQVLTFEGKNGPHFRAFTSGLGQIRTRMTLLVDSVNVRQFLRSMMGILGQSLESTVSQDANPHQKGCYTHASCKFAVEQTAIFRSRLRKEGRKVRPNQADPVTCLGCFLATFAAKCPPEFTRIWSERSPVERFLRNPIVVLLNIRANCSLLALKPAHSSSKLPSGPSGNATSQERSLIFHRTYMGGRPHFLTWTNRH